MDLRAIGGKSRTWKFALCSSIVAALALLAYVLCLHLSTSPFQQSDVSGLDDPRVPASALLGMVATLTGLVTLFSGTLAVLAWILQAVSGGRR